MRKYNNLLSTVEAYFSVEGESSSEGLLHLKKDLQESFAYRENLRAEILESLNDDNFSWKNALWDEFCHVENFETEKQAREFVVDNLLSILMQAT